MQVMQSMENTNATCDHHSMSLESQEEFEGDSVVASKMVDWMYKFTW